MAIFPPLRLLDCFGFTNPLVAAGTPFSILEGASCFFRAFFGLIVDVEGVSKGEFKKAEGDDIVIVSIDA